MHGVYPHLAAGGPVTFVATKVTKKAVSRNASLQHEAFTLQISQNHGLLNLTSTSFTHSHASARFANAPATTQTNMFCPISSEAYLLTEKKMSLLLECYLTELND